MLPAALHLILTIGFTLGLNGSFREALPPYCKTQDTLMTELVYLVKKFTTESSYASFRVNSLKIPDQLVEADISAVADEATCQQAATAYDRDMTPETPTINRGVYVVRVKDWYLVVDGQDKSGEWTRGYIITNTFAKHSEAVGW